MSSNWTRLLCFALLALLSSQPVLAQEGQADEEVEAPEEEMSFPGFGGPNSVANQLEEDATSTDSLTGAEPFQGWFDWKDSLREKHGFSFTVDYTSGVVGASDVIGDEDLGVGGAVRFYGSWALVGRESGNTGSFIWKVENRHGYTDIPPSAVAAEAGYVGLILPVLSDIQNRLTNLYWRQNLKQGRVELLVGMLDTTDWVDLFVLASPWTGFYNFALATGSATIPVPDDGALGMNLNAMLNDKFYLLAGFADSNADSTDPFNGFDTFGDAEFFKTIEIGRTTSQDRFYLDNVHLTYWHADERETAGVSKGWGLNFSFTHSFDEKWMPFLRAGYTEDGGSLLQKSVSTGVGRHLSDGRSLVGMGLNFGEPNEDTLGPGLRDQTAIEIFARLVLARNFEITPDLQLILDPAKNPDVNQTWVYGLRARLSF